MYCQMSKYSFSFLIIWSWKRNCHIFRPGVLSVLFASFVVIDLNAQSKFPSVGQGLCSCRIRLCSCCPCRAGLVSILFSMHKMTWIWFGITTYLSNFTIGKRSGNFISSFCTICPVEVNAHSKLRQEQSPCPTVSALARQEQSPCPTILASVCCLSLCKWLWNTRRFANNCNHVNEYFFFSVNPTLSPFCSICAFSYFIEILLIQAVNRLFSFR